MVQLGLGRLCTPIRTVILASLAVIAVVLYHIKVITETPWYYKPAPCSYSLDSINATVWMTNKVHHVLNYHNVEHFLCYGSLWGALRRQDILPWDNDVEFCVIKDDLEDKHEQVQQSFKVNNILYTYYEAEGIYVIGQDPAHVELYIFELTDDYEWLVGSGHKKHSWFSNKRQDRFPSALAAPPLKTLKFHDLDLPVPKGDIEIQKYFYPKDWWIEVKPPGC